MEASKNQNQCSDDDSKYEIHVPLLPQTVQPDPRGLGSVILERLEKNADTVCQIDSVTGLKQTRREVREKSIRVALEMKARGITHNDVVSLCSGNHPDIVLPFIASMCLGAKVASLTPDLTPLELSHLLNLVRPKIIFTESIAVENLEKSLKEIGLSSEIVVFGESRNHSSFKEFLERKEEEKNFKPYRPKDLQETAVIFFSSGTTGMPKGVCNTHHSLLGQLVNFDGFNMESVILLYSPLYWLSAVLTLLGSLLTTSVRIICNKFTEESFLQLIEKYKINMTYLSPNQATTLLKLSHLFAKYDLSSLQTFLFGGSPIGAEFIRAYRKLLPKCYIIMSGYGMTEANGGLLMFDPRKDMQLMINKPGSVGRPMPGCSYKIVDIETGKTLGPNQIGELRAKFPYAMSGYYNNPEESKKAWDENGWYMTGDVGYYDEDQCFYIVDRIKEMLKYQNYQVVPAELEQLLVQHPGVKEAVVVGVPDELDGDHPAAVIIKTGNPNVTEDEIIKYVDGLVSNPKKLRGGVRFVESIPTTVTGKYRRRDVRKMLIDGSI